jgi:hypothetical protein
MSGKYPTSWTITASAPAAMMATKVFLRFGEFVGENQRVEGDVTFTPRRWRNSMSFGKSESENCERACGH